jgi:DNA-binding NtrC family response regulator
MDNLLLAVLIHERPDPFEALKGILSDLSVESYSITGYRDAKDLIAEYHPLLIFVDQPIWSRWHADIVKMAREADQTFNIIVVGPLLDIQLYVSAMEQGAFNYVAPPFSHRTLTVVVHSAAMDARDHRDSLALVASAHAAS